MLNTKTEQNNCNNNIYTDIDILYDNNNYNTISEAINIHNTYNVDYEYTNINDDNSEIDNLNIDDYTFVENKVYNNNLYNIKDFPTHNNMFTVIDSYKIMILDIVNKFGDYLQKERIDQMNEPENTKKILKSKLNIINNEINNIDKIKNLICNHNWYDDEIEINENIIKKIKYCDKCYLNYNDISI